MFVMLVGLGVTGAFMSTGGEVFLALTGLWSWGLVSNHEDDD